MAQHPSAYNRGIASLRGAEELAAIANALASGRDEATLANLKHRVLAIAAASPLPGATAAACEEEAAHLKKLGPIELAREVAWRAEDQYGNAQRHLDITLIEMAAAKGHSSPVPSGGGNGGDNSAMADALLAEGENTTRAPTEEGVAALLSKIRTQRAAIELFVELQVPGPSYYRKRAQSKGAAAQPYYGIGGGGGGTNSGGGTPAHPPPPPSRLAGGIDALLGGSGGGEGDYDLGALSVPQGTLLGRGRAASGAPQSQPSASGSVADDYLALLAEAAGGNPPQHQHQQPSASASASASATASPQHHHQRQQQQQQRPPAAVPVVGYPVDASSLSAPAEGVCVVSPTGSGKGAAPLPQVNYDVHGIYGGGGAGNGRGAQPVPAAHSAGGYSYDPSAHHQQQQHQYDPSGLYSKPQPAANPPPQHQQRPAYHQQPVPPQQPQRPPTAVAASSSAADDYMSLLAGALGGSGGGRPTAAAPTASAAAAKGGKSGGSSKEEEYLAILAQIAENKKKSHAIEAEEKKKAEAEAAAAAAAKEKEKPAPSSSSAPAPSAPPAAKKAGGGGGGAAPPPMSSAFKSLIGDMANIGAVTGDGGRADALQARNAAHSLSSAGANYAPKTSQFVLKGVEVSAALMKQRQFKKSVDILQHVFDQGKLETHNTRTFEASMTAAIGDARRRYYEHHPPRLLQVNPISDDEMRLLSESGKTSTAFFPIWDDVNDGYAAENVYYPAKPIGSGSGGTGGVGYGLSIAEAPSWEDPFSPRLSAKQIKAGARWTRAPALLEQFADKDVIASSPGDTGLLNATSANCSSSSSGGAIGLITTCDPMAIKQTIVGDCSLVCSLIVCASYQRRFPQGKIISHVIFPQEEANAASGIAVGSQLTAGPVINAAGKYCIKMLVNGITRMIVIDDRLPAVPATDKHLPILACSYSTDPREMWVSLMEKAFVKVCGGTYDFPGSNSSTDLYHLSGWLPDYLACDSPNFDAALQWQRLAAQHRRGGLLATLNTPANMDTQTSEKLKLIPGHAYAILDMREANGHKLVKIKNPWTRDNSWEGAFSPKDTQRMTPQLRAELAFTEEETKRGVFWMCWEDVCRYFSRIHLSWNPYCLYSSGPSGAFVKPTRIARHGHWAYTNALTQKPQFDIIAKNSLGRKTRLHLVLSRHILNLDEYHIKGGRHDQIRPEGNNNTNVFDECPQGRPEAGGGKGTGDADPSDYVPLITVHIYDTSAYPSVGQTVVSLEPVGSACGGGKWPGEGSRAMVEQLTSEGKNKPHVSKTPLATVIERHPTAAGIIGVSSSSSSAASSSSNHMTTSFTGRRIDNSTQLPNANVTDAKTGGIAAYGTLVHNGVYKNVPHQTISFDCPPTSSGGTDVRRFTVVVSQLLPKAERDAKPGAPRATYPALRTFPFSLTLHSELPMLDRDTSAALLTRAVNLPQGLAGRSFINMTTIPTLGQLPFVTKAKGHWIGGMNCGGKVGTRTFGFNPQFLLTIPPPTTTAADGASAQHLTHLLATVTSQSAVETVQIHVVCLKDASAALITQQQRAASSSAPTIPPWFGRLFTITDEEAKFVLSCERYGWQSAAVDTSLTSCLQFDDTETLKRAADPSAAGVGPTPTFPSSPNGSTSARPIASPVPTGGGGGGGGSLGAAKGPTSTPRLMPVALKVPNEPSMPPGAHACYFMPFPRHRTSLALLPLIADGVFAVPLHARMVFGGQQLPLVGDDGNAASAPQFAQTSAAGGGLVTPSTPAIDQKLAQVFAPSAAIQDSYDATAKMMSNAGTDASVIKLITVVPNVPEEVKGFIFGGDGGAVGAEMKTLWGDMTALAQRLLAQFASWFGCGRWAEAVEVLTPEALRRGAQRPSVAAANQFLRRRFAGVPDASLADARRREAEKASIALGEEVLRLITQIDKFGIDTGDDETMRTARRALVSAAQSVLHEACDELQRAIADVDRHQREGESAAATAPSSTPTLLSPTTADSSSSSPAAPVVPATTALNRLPPGQYVIAVSQWTSGTPAPFEIVVETEVPHVLTELPPEGSDSAPEAAAANGQQGGVVGYKKWHTMTLNGTFAGASAQQQGGFLRCSGMYDRTVPLTSGLFQTYPSITIFVPNAAGALTIAARVVISPPADASDGERSLPPGAVGSGQLLLFSEPPDGSAQLIADSGDDASANDISLIATNNKDLGQSSVVRTLGNTKVLGSDGGCTRISLNTASLVGGRRYRLLLLLRPAVSFRGGAQLPFMARVFCSTPGATATLHPAK